MELLVRMLMRNHLASGSQALEWPPLLQLLLQHRSL